MKAIEQYSPVVLFVMLYKVVLTFESVDGILLKVSLPRRCLYARPFSPPHKRVLARRCLSIPIV